MGKNFYDDKTPGSNSVAAAKSFGTIYRFGECWRTSACSASVPMPRASLSPVEPPARVPPDVLKSRAATRSGSNRRFKATSRCRKGSNRSCADCKASRVHCAAVGALKWIFGPKTAFGNLAKGKAVHGIIVAENISKNRQSSWRSQTSAFLNIRSRSISSRLRAPRLDDPRASEPTAERSMQGRWVSRWKTCLRQAVAYESPITPIVRPHSLPAKG